MIESKAFGWGWECSSLWQGKAFGEGWCDTIIAQEHGVWVRRVTWVCDTQDW